MSESLSRSPKTNKAQKTWVDLHDILYTLLYDDDNNDSNLLQSLSLAHIYKHHTENRTDMWEEMRLIIKIFHFLVC